MYLLSHIVPSLLDELSSKLISCIDFARVNSSYNLIIVVSPQRHNQSRLHNLHVLNDMVTDMSNVSIVNSQPGIYTAMNS